MQRTVRIVWICGSPALHRSAVRLATAGAFRNEHIFSSAKEAFAAKSTWNASVCIVEDRLPDAMGTEFIRQVARLADAPKFILIGELDHGRDVQEAILAGADALLATPLKEALLHAAVSSVRDGNVSIPGTMLAAWVRHVRHAHAPVNDGLLSEREQRVLQLLAEGLTYKGIAERLFLSPFTVKNHVHHIVEKLGVRTRMEAVSRFLQHRHCEAVGGRSSL